MTACRRGANLQVRAGGRALREQFLTGWKVRFTLLTKARNVCLVFLGVAALVLKGHYRGSGEEAVRSYGGNIAASFAVYFVVSQLRFPSKFDRLLTAGVALAVVELFEAADGFGMMTNVYDRIDFAANAVGVALAVALDIVMPGGQRR